MKNTTHLILGMLALTFGMEVKAQIQLPSVFSDGMVLQQNSKVAVWGWGNPSETLMILSEWNPGDTVRTVVDNQGRWKAEVPTGRAGGPYTLEVKGGNDSRKLSDVMLGEVWLCSGQSNMEWSANMGIMNGEQEVKQAASPSVRIFHNPKQGADTPQTDCRTKWEVATPESMRKTSATAYFFARYLTEHLKVPVGILVSAWGGTPAEVWTPAEIVEKDEILSKNKLKDYPWWPIKPGVLYNQMIHPLVPYQIAGCIWYQGESLCRFLRENKKILDVLFLDIELLTTNGIEVGRFIREEQENMETAIVYISANSSYAMDLFRVQPTDFLIKPLDKIKVGNVMNRIQKISEVRKGIFEYFGSGYYFKVLYKDILYFSSQNKKVHLVLKDGQKEFNGKLKEIAKKIPGNFIQIHQSYLINFDYIEECSYESVKMKNGDTIPISQPYRKSVRKQLAERVWRERE